MTVLKFFHARIESNALTIKLAIFNYIIYLLHFVKLFIKYYYLCIINTSVLLEGEVFDSEVFHYCLRCKDQNICNIHICIQFCALFDENEGVTLMFWRLPPKP